ncbi:MAG: hypothetical protein Q4B68_07950, partial [Bacteroidales bacterium]|nr:hypothetical protein [Bacteroidales bacterium]
MGIIFDNQPMTCWAKFSVSTIRLTGANPKKNKKIPVHAKKNWSTTHLHRHRFIVEIQAERAILGWIWAILGVFLKKMQFFLKKVPEKFADSK